MVGIEGNSCISGIPNDSLSSPFKTPEKDSVLIHSGPNRSDMMEHEETYQGERMVITTRRQRDGTWTSRVDLLDSGRKTLLAALSDYQYQSEDDARRAALSLAVEAIDRARISRGKP